MQDRREVGTDDAAPLTGVRVIDLTRFAAGPWATSLLADMGADVLKIEAPASGDGSRYFDDVYGYGMSSYFAGLNRSKRSVALDVRRPEGREVLLRMVEGADVFVDSFRPGWAEEHALGPQVLHEVNPSLVSCTLTPFGQRGPIAHLPGMDIIAQALGGMMGLTGERGGTPCKAGPPVADFTASFLFVNAVLLGLYTRERTGRGTHIDTSLLAGQIALLPNFITGFVETGQPDGPYGSGHPQLVPYQAFPTSDGDVVIGCLTEAHWERLCKILQLQHLLTDARFARNVNRIENRDELIPLLSAETRKRDRSHWVELLNAQGVPTAPVNSLADIVQDEQVLQNGLLQAVDAGELGTWTLVGNPLELHPGSTVPPRRAPHHGEHTIEALTELGLPDDEIQFLLADGVCRQHGKIAR